MDAPPPTDATHDPALLSWVESANEPDSDFPVQNLPYGRFRPRGGEEPWRIGVAIGDQVLDLRQAAELSPWSAQASELLRPLAAGELEAFMALGRPAWQAMRAALSAALSVGSIQQPFLELCLLPRRQCEMAMPCTVRNYTDFYTGIHHARAIGALLRPDNPLLPNYPWVPIGYHGRASSVSLGGDVKRPSGQLKMVNQPPVFQPCRRLDYELELGALVGRANALGEPVPIDQAEDTLFGLVLLNDWSARDIQSWEYQPLGPFLAKSFATSISPWVVTMEALAPLRRPFVRPAGDPQPLPYLDSAANREAGAIELVLEVWLQTAAMRDGGLAPVRLSESGSMDAYWTWAQLVAHHTSNGCNLQIGDLLGSGTLSGPQPGQGGSLMELTAGGRQVIPLPGGQQRGFLEDGDTVILRAWGRHGTVRIGFGELSGTIRG